MKDKELLKTINISELKEKLNANLVIKYAIENYKLDRNKFEITHDNKIDNLKNNQKPKNTTLKNQRHIPGNFLFCGPELKFYP